MKEGAIIVTGLAMLVAVVGCVGSARPARAQTPAAHIGPDTLYPDLLLTPGEATTLDVAVLTATYTDHCPEMKTPCSYSGDHRNVPSVVRQRVYDEYNVPQSARNIRSGEVDHFYPLCAGGSNSIGNLWYQPSRNAWNGRNFGYHEKDDLEVWACEQIAAHNLDPALAYERITGDWVAYYLEVKPPHYVFGKKAKLSKSDD
jgi:hypothetical protein